MPSINVTASAKLQASAARTWDVNAVFIVTPAQLNPPYRSNNDEEMRAAMAALKPEAIAPLSVPTMDL